MNRSRTAARRRGAGYFVSRFFILLLLFLTFFPFLSLLNMSVKQNLWIKLDYFGPPNPFIFDNYARAIDFIMRPVLNSLYVCAVSVALILIMVSLSGYAFGRMQFAGKRLLFSLILAVLMIPYTLLIVPNFRIVKSMGLINSYFALILPYIGGQQIFGIIISRTFFSSLPNEMFESARMDGANELQCYARIAMPLSVPTLITVGVTSVVAMYNDYIWPTLVLTTDDMMKTFCQIVFNNAAGNGSLDFGMLAAAFVLGTLPLLVITCSFLKYYLQGMLEGAVKG